MTTCRSPFFVHTVADLSLCSDGLIVSESPQKLTFFLAPGLRRVLFSLSWLLSRLLLLLLLFAGLVGGKQAEILEVWGFTLPKP